MIERLLQPLPGVMNVRVNVIARSTTVRHDATKTTPEQLVSALNAAYLDASFPLLHGPETAAANQEQNAKCKFLVPVFNLFAHGPRWWVTISGLSWVVSMLSDAGYPSLRWVALVSIAFGLPMLARKGFSSARVGVLDINCLMVLAVVGAIALGDYLEAAAVTFLFSLSGQKFSFAIE